MKSILAPNQRDQLNKIIRQSTISRRRSGGSGRGDLAVAGGGGSSGGGFEAGLAVAELVEVGKTKSFTQVLSLC